MCIRDRNLTNKHSEPYTIYPRVLNSITCYFHVSNSFGSFLETKSEHKEDTSVFLNRKVIIFFLEPKRTELTRIINFSEDTSSFFCERMLLTLVNCYSE